MKVYLDASKSLSRAMFRVANALRRTAPMNVHVVDEPENCDLEILHAIDDRPARGGSDEYAVIQYCRYTSQSQSNWQELWGGARAVWSYYDLDIPPQTRFFHAPLGVHSEVFTLPKGHSMRPIGIVSSGYVSGPLAEAIEEVAEAAKRLRLSVFHLGPSSVEGMKARREHSWKSGTGLTDAKLVEKYQNARWVSGLRHVEGFELPVIEGLACGARPIVFDRPDMRKWYDGYATFVPECSGEELVKELVNVMSLSPNTVTLEERKDVVADFNWDFITAGFWEALRR